MTLINLKKQAKSFTIVELFFLDTLLKQPISECAWMLLIFCWVIFGRKCHKEYVLKIIWVCIERLKNQFQHVLK
uniref:Uncharacterized protein n=1 Tax=Acinetobacter seifertii TaxID=1530123 RepID=A0A5P1I673_9GAMM|nr:hypothetical protein ASP1069_00033 [Acinetobacter seifertii]